MAKRTKDNPYGLVRVTAPPPPKEKKKKVVPQGPPRPKFNPGDMVTTIYRPLMYSIPRPTKVLEVKENRLCVDGWALVVETSDGPKELNVGHFTKYKPAQ